MRSDFQHLEQALKIICPNLTDLGRPYRLLKSMATLVALTPEEIVASQASGSCVPPSTVLLLLFTFAGPELASPHQNTGWSITKLSVWLDEHPSEAERLVKNLPSYSLGVYSFRMLVIMLSIMTVYSCSV